MKFLTLSVFSLLLCVAANSNALAADIQINNLDDLSATGIPGTTRNLEMIEKLCIGLRPAGNYDITARGDGPGGNFELSSGVNVLNYRVYFRDRNEGFHELFASVPLTGVPGRKLQQNQGCSGNAVRIRLEIDYQQINQAAAGVYRGTLVLMVTPE